MNIVLAHGIYGFKTRFRVNYFNGVAPFLRNSFGPSLKVLVTEVAPAGRIELRGTQLAELIVKALESGEELNSGENVHIIAHSMGGLDARFCLSKNVANIGNCVDSLTTISTPHRGSPVADLLTANNMAEPLIRSTLDKIAKDLDMELDGLQDLTTTAAAEFNERIPDNARVQYFSHAGRGRNGVARTCIALLPAHAVISSVTGGEENDGLVTVSSATWGPAGLIDLWDADHADEIGHDLDGGLQAAPESFPHLHKYQAIVERLQTLPSRSLGG